MTSPCVAAIFAIALAACAFGEPPNIVVSQKLSVSIKQTPFEAQELVRLAHAAGCNGVDLCVDLVGETLPPAVPAAIVQAHRLGLVANVQLTFIGPRSLEEKSAAAKAVARRLIELHADGLIFDGSLVPPADVNEPLMTRLKNIQATDAMVQNLLRAIREQNRDLLLIFDASTAVGSSLSWEDWPRWCCERPNWDAFIVDEADAHIVTAQRPSAAIVELAVDADVKTAIADSVSSELGGVRLRTPSTQPITAIGNHPLLPAGWRAPATPLRREGERFFGKIDRAATYSVLALRDGLWSIEQSIELPSGQASIVSDAESIELVIER